MKYLSSIIRSFFTFFFFFYFSFSAAAQTVTLIFTGDIMCHEAQLKAAYNQKINSYDFTYQFKLLKPYLNADAIIGNFETVLGGKCPYTGYPCFNTPDSLADTLKELDFKVLTLANNHIFDVGSKGAIRTSSILQEKGFSVTGLSINAPLLCEWNGIKIGFINASYGTNSEISFKDVAVNIISEKFIHEHAEILRSQGADLIIALLHWGIEYQPVPSNNQLKQARYCKESGVDLIIGTHPHILQPITIEQDEKIIFWSLGNLISAQRTLPRERTMLVKVKIEKEDGKKAHITHASILPIAVLKVIPEGKQIKGFSDVPPGCEELLSSADAKLASKIHANVLQFLKIPADVIKDDDGFFPVFNKIKAQSELENQKIENQTSPESNAMEKQESENQTSPESNAIEKQESENQTSPESNAMD